MTKFLSPIPAAGRTAVVEPQATLPLIERFEEVMHSMDNNS